MTITLSPETATLLREQAERERQEPEALGDALLAEAIRRQRQIEAETVAAVQQALAECEAGRERSLKEFLAERRVKRGLPESWPSPETIREISPGVVVIAK